MNVYKRKVERKVKENQLDEGGNIKYETESMSNITLLTVAPSELRNIIILYEFHCSSGGSEAT